MEIRLLVRGDVESVAGWWADPARRLELRSQYNTPSVTGFSWKDSFEGPQLIEEGEWTTARRLIQVRITTTLAPDGDSVWRRADGSFVRESEFRQVRRTHSGREDETVSHRVMEFTEAGHSRTTLLSRITVQRTGYPWWERAQVRTSELQHRWTHLDDWVSRCEADIADGSSKAQ
jgi:hypothetical protein